MVEGTCGTCKHWREGAAEREGFGECGLIASLLWDIDPVPEGHTAFLQACVDEGLAYDQSLYTSAAFGCTMYNLDSDR